MITGFAEGTRYVLSALLVGAGLAGAYALLGATWLVIKTEGELYRRAPRWSHGTVVLAALGVASISLASPSPAPGS